MKKILVIEDEPQMRRNVCTILTMEGFTAVSAINGAEGVNAARTELPDLILCDVMMPELDGYGVLERLRRDPATSGIPFIFLTARGEKADIRTGINLGADDYLTKPIAAHDLLTVIRARLQRPQPQGSLDNVRIHPDFTSPKPLESLGLTPREAEVLLWVAQGKSNADITAIPGMSEGTVKEHLEHILAKLGVESRDAATQRAISALSSTVTRR